MSRTGTDVLVVRTVDALRAQIGQWRQSNGAPCATLGFVPTMGNLHAGHLQLVEAACKGCDRVVVSIFVNPLQFGPNEDFSTYPRTFEEDVSKLSDYGVDLVFSPEPETLYPKGKERSSCVTVPGLSEILEGACRPGFFMGVATVVSKLFNLVQPDRAYFGEKDYQQLKIIQQMVADLCFPVEVVPVATVREEDGLAMSSRNQYLDVQQRTQSSYLYQVLQEARQAVLAGKPPGQVEQASCEALQDAGFEVDYVSLRCAETLEAVEDIATFSLHNQRLVLLAAARLGGTRLIDNVLFSLPDKVP